MTSDLEHIVRADVERQLLREIQSTGTSLTQAQQDQMLEVLRREGHVDRKVRETLDGFVEQAIKRQTKDAKKAKCVLSFVNVLMTIGIGYTVNITVWPAVAILGLIYIVIQIYFIQFTDV